jgi:hypothetical protein
MQSKFLRAICVLACFALAAPLFAQYGHPLKGTFSGDFWIQKGKETHITIEFNYDGDKDLVTGTLNPGPEGAPLQKLAVTPPPLDKVSEAMKPWAVNFEVDAKDDTGKAVHYVVQGNLENIGAFNKHLGGVWTANGQKGEFKMIMQ